MLRQQPLVHLRTVALALVAAFLLAACSEDPEFRMRDLSGAMPDLAFELERAPTEEPVTAADFEGKVVALFFGFTHCPDYCPMTLAHFSAVLNELDEAQREDMRFLFVSVDPERDTPELLASYTAAFGEEFVGLRGDHETLRDLTRRYRTTFGYGEPDEHGFYDVSHSTAAFVFDREGKIRLLARESEPLEDLEHDLRLLLDGL